MINCGYVHSIFLVGLENEVGFFGFPELHSWAHFSVEKTNIMINMCVGFHFVQVFYTMVV